MLTTMPDTLWVGVTVGYYYCRCCCYLQIQVVPTNQKYINTKKKKKNKNIFFLKVGWALDTGKKRMLIDLSLGATLKKEVL